jgi:hypothetical protein
MTGLDLITSALRLTGALGQGEVASPEEGQDGLQRLNDLMDWLSADGLTVFSRAITLFALTNGTGSYTVGPGGNFVYTVRPPLIEGASITVNRASLTVDDLYWLANFGAETLGLPPRFWRMLKDTGEATVRFPIQIIESLTEWSSILERSSATANVVLKAFYDAAFPLANLYLFPIPLGGNIELNTWIPFTSFANLATVVSLPPAYQRFLQYRLGADMAPEYGGQAGPDVIGVIAESLQSIKNINTQFAKRTEPTLAEAREAQAAQAMNPQQGQPQG